MKMELRRRAIDKLYKRRDRIEMPDFQREEVWQTSKKRLLIDSILRNWHMPKFYLRKLDDGSTECVDGQQRLAAIFEFFEGQLEVTADTAKRVGAKNYRDLPDEVSDKFDDYEIDIEEIEDASEGELEELFQRLQLGTPLNTSEKLNAVRGEARDFCLKASKMPFFSEKVALKNTRYAHFERVVRWLFIEARSILPQMRFPQLQGFLKDNRTYSEESDTARCVLGALTYLNEAFPTKITILRSRANILTVCMLAARVFSQQLHRNTATAFGDFIHTYFTGLSEEIEKGVKSQASELLRYQQAVNSDSAGGKSIQTRIEILTKRLAVHHGCFAPLLGRYVDAKEAADLDLAGLAEQLTNHVLIVNRKYSGEYGVDLFKMTNETTASLSGFKALCCDGKMFGEFVDALYFLLYEGSGQCKRLPSPPPQMVMDVKFLRGSFRHDPDHGTPNEIAKKRIRNAGVLEKYSGKKSLGECAPEDILRAQLMLMRRTIALLVDLMNSPV